MDLSKFKAGFVSIIGKPNVGKSTLMNRLIGEKLSIVSPKPQTTRNNIRGFYNSAEAQVIFLDTPGFLEPRYELQSKMLSYIQESLKNSDVVLFIADVNDFPSEYDEKVIAMLKGVRKPVVAVLNKSEKLGVRSEDREWCSVLGGRCSEDIPKNAERTSNNSSDYTPNTDCPTPNNASVEVSKTEDRKPKTENRPPFDKVFYLSALYDNNFKDLLDCLINFLPFSPPLYSQDDLSDMPLRFFAAEIIREKIFLFYEAEIPYSSTVIVEKWSEEAERDVIQANIWIERDSQKPIIIGKNGTQIAKVREQAEKDIMQLTGRKAVLNLWVKVKNDWRKKKGALNEFGYR